MGFSKRFYTPRTFLGDLYRILLSFPSILETVRSRRVSRSFAEKIMLVVTQVNGCRYCDYGHTRMAVRSGVSLEEIGKLATLEFADFSPEQVPALEFARHFAEKNGKPDPVAQRRLVDTYGPETSQDILNYIRMITLGNLSGNTADAFISRLKGVPAPGNSIFNELVLFILFAPVILPLLFVMQVSKSNREKTATSA
jgi:AhpD family alkylhydroperoxidase